MNFTEALSQFQGVLVSADNIHSFSQLSAKGGNEDDIAAVIENITKFLEQGGYIKNGEVNRETALTMRLFAMYIVLNADLPVLHKMVESEGIDSVVWTITTVPQCLMCELMWNIQMGEFIHEIISYTHPQLAIEVSSAFLDNLKYADPTQSINQLKLLSSACYNTIMRLHLFNSDVDDILKKATASFNNLKSILKYFQFPPNDYKLNGLSKSELYEYYGKRFYAMLDLINTCLESFTTNLDINTPGSDVYKLTYEVSQLKTDIPATSVCDIQHKILSDCHMNSHTEMLDVCKALVMDISIDVFCQWSEVQDNGKTMQQTIGELCYKVRNKLMSISIISEHIVVSMMKEIARKPDEMADIINATSDDEIMQKISSSEDSKLWIQSLIHKERLCQNLELLKVVSSNINLFDEEQCHKLYTMFNDNVKLNIENREYIEMLLLEVFHQCSVPTKFMILDQHFNNNNFVDMKKTADFNDSMTETFNKLIAAPDSDRFGVLTLFLQNPQEVYTKIFSLATENMCQADVMLNVMKMLEKYSNYYYDTETEPCVIKILQEVIHNQLQTTAKENNFIKFLRGLKEANIIPGSKLLLLIIMTNMHQGLITKDVESISFHVKLLKEGYQLDELMAYRAPMLAMLGKVLDVVRWKMNTFSTNAPTALNATLDMQKILINTYDSGDLPENECDWLKSKVSNLEPLNMYYYRSLWHPPGDNYFEVISGFGVRDMVRDEISSWLSQVIASCTQQEWCEMWANLSQLTDAVKLDVFLAALGMITLAERAYRTENTAACLLYCYRNFIYIIRYKYFKEPLTDTQVSNVISHLATVAELMKEFQDELTNILRPLFAYMTERQSDYSLNYLEFMNKQMKASALTKLMNKMFINGNA